MARLLTMTLLALGTTTQAAPKRDFYYPQTEELGSKEMRVIALGTGTPHIRPSQAATSWLVELGNGAKFIFDIGTGALRNLSSLQIPYDQINKVFLSHLHVDHMGDLDALWASGWTGGRLEPLHVWGPSGTERRLGTEHFIDNLVEAMHWDFSTRNGKLPYSGSRLIAHEFDFSKSHVIYDENGVVIRSFPAIHILDGAVSYRLEWEGLTFVFSGDTTPSKWMIQNAKDADILVHDVYLTIDQLVARFGWDNRMATDISRSVHTTPAAAGKIYSTLQPRMAVGFHFYNDFDTTPAIEKEIRQSYQGPLTLAQDLMVFNVTEKSISVRQGITPENIWPNIPDKDKYAKAERASGVKSLSDWIRDGQLKIDIYGGSPVGTEDRDKD